MPVKIRLMRIGATRRPFYRVVAVDERKKRTGSYLELLGTYNPLTQPKQLDHLTLLTKLKQPKYRQAKRQTPLTRPRPQILRFHLIPPTLLKVSRRNERFGCLYRKTISSSPG